jgi:hypothetical protein
VPDREELQQVMRDLHERNLEKTLGRLDRVRALLADGCTEPPVEQVRADLHALTGAVGAYPWTGGSDLLVEVRRRLLAGGPYADVLEPFDLLVAEVRAGRPATPWR